jgi:hypothetical protein
LCCSNYGWCGATERDCSESNCLKDYSRCESSTTVSGRCGLLFGSELCAVNQFCSAFGYCSEFSTEFDQEDFNGLTHAKPDFTLTGYRCGPDFNEDGCPDGLCCSKSGWCGNTEEYCAESNCLKYYSRCESSTILTGRCGLAFGSSKCDLGLFCDAFGYCNYFESLNDQTRFNGVQVGSTNTENTKQKSTTQSKAFAISFTMLTTVSY